MGLIRRLPAIFLIYFYCILILSNLLKKMPARNEFDIYLPLLVYQYFTPKLGTSTSIQEPNEPAHEIMVPIT